MRPSTSACSHSTRRSARDSARAYRYRLSAGALQASAQASVGAANDTPAPSMPRSPSSRSKSARIASSRSPSTVCIPPVVAMACTASHGTGPPRWANGQTLGQDAYTNGRAALRLAVGSHDLLGVELRLACAHPGQEPMQCSVGRAARRIALNQAVRPVQPERQLTHELRHLAILEVRARVRVHAAAIAWEPRRAWFFHLPTIPAGAGSGSDSRHRGPGQTAAATAAEHGEIDSQNHRCDRLKCDMDTQPDPDSVRLRTRRPPEETEVAAQHALESASRHFSPRPPEGRANHTMLGRLIPVVRFATIAGWDYCADCAEGSHERAGESAVPRWRGRQRRRHADRTERKRRSHETLRNYKKPTGDEAGIGPFRSV